MPIYTEADCRGLRLYVAPSLDTECPEDRIRAALGLRSGRLPEVGAEALGRYRDYLASRMVFPFLARYPEAAGLHEEILRTVTVVELFDPAKDLDCQSLGLVCRAHKGKHEVELSLADLEVDEDDPNHQLIEDYWYWFWNWR